MSSSRRSVIYLSFALFAPFALYIGFFIFRFHNIGNFLSALSAYAATGILAFVYLKSDRITKSNDIFLLLSLACCSWGLADTIWAIMTVTGGTPKSNPVVIALYIFPNIFMCYALVIFAINQLGKWDLVQTAIDVIINTFLGVMLFWLLFFSKDSSLLLSFMKSDFTGVVSIITDILIDISIYSWFLSVRSGKIPNHLKIISLGMILFTYSDIAYYYVNFFSVSFPSFLLDVGYICSLVVIAFGALLSRYGNNKTFRSDILLNTGGQNRWICLFIYPAFIMLFSGFGLVNVKLTLGDYLFLIIPIFIYWISVKYIQRSLEKEKVLSCALAESERSRETIINNLPGMAYRCLFDCKWTMQFVSDGCLNLTGYAPESLCNNKELTFNDLIAPEYRENVWNEWKRVITCKITFKYEYKIITAMAEQKWVLEMGEGVYNEAGEVVAIEGIILDISDRKGIEDNLIYVSEHDTLTGLHNLIFLERLLRTDAKTNGIKRAVVSVDLSTAHFLSRIYGYNYTQTFVKNVADNLKSHCNHKVQLFCTHENYFVFYITSYNGKEDLELFCRSVACTLESALSIEKIGGGIGVVEIDDENKHDPDKLLRNLLIASERAHNLFDRECKYSFYDIEMETQIMREEEIKRELAEITTGQSNERLYLCYQPILDIETNCISGFEALARLKSNKYGLISPLEFIPIAEKTKLIIPLGKMIFLRAFEFINKLKENGHGTLSVAVNVSAIQLVKSEFYKDIFNLLNNSHINMHNIVIEITETAFAYDFQEINDILGELKALGIKIAIDDFGTGYSSLGRERDLSVDCIKIDKSFIDRLMMLQEDEAITGDIISIAHKLGHYVVAEGVEHDKQMKYLISHGCDKIQGYLISKPLDEDTAIEFLETKKFKAIDNS